MLNGISRLPLVEPIEPRTMMTISFLPAVQSPVGSTTVMVLGRFGSDVAPDVIARVSDGSLRYFPGLGNGQFVSTAISAPIDAGPNVTALLAADFNRDGTLDLAAVNGGTAANTGAVRVLQGLGNGMFAPAQSYYAGPSPTGVAVGDVNGDGRLDLVVSNNAAWPAPTPTQPGGHGAGVLLGTNTGFSAATRLPLPIPTTAVAAGVSVSPTVNRASTILAFAGRPLLSPTTSPSTTVVIVPGLLTPAATINTRFTLPGSNLGLAAGNLRQDGHSDFAVLQSLGNAGTTNSGGTTVYTILSRTPTNAAPASYELKGPFPTGFSYATAITAADFDHSLTDDVAVTGLRTFSPVPSTPVGGVAVLSNPGTGMLTAPLLFATGSIAPRAVAAGDVNGDGLADIVTSTTTGLSALLNDTDLFSAFRRGSHDELNVLD